MVAAPAPAATAPRHMSWAERAKAPAGPSSDSAKGASPAPSNASTSASTQSHSLSESVKNGPSAIPNGSSSSHQRSGSDFANTTTESSAPSVASKTDEEEPVAPPVAKAPPTNVWKERMAAAATQQPTKSAIKASQAPSPVNNVDARASLPNGRPSARTKPVGPPQAAPPALSDTTNWPNPLDAEKSKAAAEEAVQKVRATETSPSAASTASQDPSKVKKTKWVPIEADITFDAPLPTRYLKDGERSRPGTRSHSRDTPASSKPRAQSASQQSEIRPDVPLSLPQNQQAAAALPGWPAPPEGTTPLSKGSLPTSLPLKPPSASMPAPGSPHSPMRADSPRLNGFPLPQAEGLKSPTTPGAAMSRSASGSSAGRSGPPIAGSSNERIDGPPQMRAESHSFVPNRGGFASARGGRGRGEGRAGSSPRSPQGGFQRGGGRGGFRGGRGGFSNAPMPHNQPPNGAVYFDGSYMPYPYMPQMPYAPMPPHMQQMAQTPFNMMPMLNSLPPAPFKTDYNPPLNPQQFYLLGQAEYYVSPDNLAKDLFLRRQMDSEGWIEMRTVVTFKRISALTQSVDLLRDTLLLSPLLDVDYEGYKFRLKQEWERWIMPDAKPATPTVASNGTNALHEQEDASKSVENSASEDGSGTTGMTSPSLSSASQIDDVSNAPKAEAASTA